MQVCVLSVLRQAFQPFHCVFDDNALKQIQFKQTLHMNTRNSKEPRKVIVKMMTVNRDVDDVFNFFEDVKNMEIGGQ